MLTGDNALQRVVDCFRCRFDRSSPISRTLHLLTLTWRQWHFNAEVCTQFGCRSSLLTHIRLSAAYLKTQNRPSPYDRLQVHVHETRSSNDGQWKRNTNVPLGQFVAGYSRLSFQTAFQIEHNAVHSSSQSDIARANQCCAVHRGHQASQAPQPVVGRWHGGASPSRGSLQSFQDKDCRRLTKNC